MNFLFFWSDWLAEKTGSLLTAAGGAALDIFRTICFSIDTVLYKLIIFLYNWFLMLCNGRILDSEMISKISNKFSIILGTFMLFYVAISFIRMILDPDKINDKEIGVASVVKKVIIVVVMLGLSNNAFELLYDFQKIILGNNASGTNVIQNLLLPTAVNTNRFGEELSWQLLNSFYHVDNQLEETVFQSDGDPNSQLFLDCENFYAYFREQVLESQKFSLGYNCLNEKTTITNTGNDAEYVMSFDDLISVIVGGFVVYLLFIYCIKVGVRVVQLAFLEILSPAAIIGYLSPKKDNMFDKWKNIYISTYIDVFIRVAIINLAVYMASIVLDSIHTGSSNFVDSVGIFQSNSNPTSNIFIPIIMILALLTFAKRAPELLKELLPKGGAGSIGFGIGAKDNVGLLAGLGAFTGASVGAIGGFAGGRGLGRLSGAIGGLAGGLFRGGKAGYGSDGIIKTFSGAKSAQSKVNLARAQRIASGAGWGESVSNSIRSTFGLQSGYDKINQELSMSKAVKTSLEDTDIIKRIDEVKQSYINSIPAGGAADPNILKQYDDAKKIAMKQMYSFAHDNDSGSQRITLTVNGTTFDEEFSSNRGIYNQIKNNERRAGRTLETYDKWKDDQNNIKNRLADKNKYGS